MIDINQLQIGDWVRLKYTNEYRSVDEYVRINGILAKGCANQYGGDGTIWGEGHGNLGGGADLFPILLTEEVLEKNPQVCRLCSFSFGIGCSYVHELQHALLLCGLNELADSFKV